MMGLILVSLIGAQTSEYTVWIDTGLCCHGSCLNFQRCFKSNHPPHCDNGKYVEFPSIFVAKVELNF